MVIWCIEFVVIVEDLFELFLVFGYCVGIVVKVKYCWSIFFSWFCLLDSYFGIVGYCDYFDGNFF